MLLLNEEVAPSLPHRLLFFFYLFLPFHCMLTVFHLTSDYLSLPCHCLSFALPFYCVTFDL